MKKIILFLFLCGYLQSPLFAQVTFGVLDTVVPTLTKVENQDLMGSNLRYFDLKPGETCQTCIDACLNDPNCKAYTYTKPGYQSTYGRCYLKSEVPTATSNINCISGVKTLSDIDKTQTAAIDQAIMEAQAAIVAKTITDKPTITKVENQDLMGGNYTYFDLKQGETCQICIDACLNDPNCKAYTYTRPGYQAPNGRCYLKSTVPNATSNINCISGVKTYLKDQSKQDQVTTLSKLENKDIPSNNYKYFDLKQGETCQTCIDACLNDPNCNAYTYTRPGYQSTYGRCYLKSAAPDVVENINCISGIKSKILFGEVLPIPPIVFENLPNYTWSPYGDIEMKGAIDLPGANYKSFFIPLTQEQLPFTCRTACLDDPNCNAWTYVEPGKQGTRAVCWLKTIGPASSIQDSVISGLRLKPLAKNLKKKQELDITNITSVKKELARFDNRWKIIMDSAIGSFNNRYYKFKADEIIQQNQLLNKSGLQLKTPGLLPEPLPRPAYTMVMKNGSITAKLKDNPAILINLRDYNLPAALPNPMPYPGFLMDFNNGAVTATFNGKTIKSVPTTANPSLKLPNITGIHSITADEIIFAELKKTAADDALKGLYTVLDCHYIIIYGKNFGKVRDTCGVRIEYDIQPYEDFSGKPPLHYAFDLIPYGGSWKNSWFDDFIVARVPPLPGPRDINKATSTAQTNKSISIWMGGEDSYLLKHEINIKSTDPGIAYIEYAPHDTPLYDKATFWIFGSGFGEYQFGKEIYILSNGKRYDVKVVPEKWSQNVIQAIAPPFMLDIETDAQLVINNMESGRKSTELSIKIGPLMSYVWITGEKYANLQIQEIQDNAQILPDSQFSNHKNVFAVSHYPNCEANHSGNDTEDWYFKDFPKDINQRGELMHPYFRYNDFFYYPLEAETDDSWEAWLSTVARESAEMYLNPVGWVGRHLIECLIISIFPGTGKYGQYLMKEPTVNDPSTAIHFNNTCWGPSSYYNVPNKYLITFQLYGPVKYFDQLENNSAEMQNSITEIFNAIKSN